MALFIALGGSVYAASNKIDGSQIKAKSLPGNRLQPGSVTATQIKKGTIGEAQLKAGAVSAKQIKANSITGAQVKAGSISGAQIQSGSLGATQINQASLTGISAANIHTVQYVSTTVALTPGTPGGVSGTASCPSGMKVVGGGAVTSNAKEAYINESGPNSERSGWFADGFGFETGVNMIITAICTPVAAPVG
ncbi:MAG TPA: hypothetical protein VGI17_12545 [Solirubrobacterales bacterium]